MVEVRIGEACATVEADADATYAWADVREWPWSGLKARSVRVVATGTGFLDVRVEGGFPVEREEVLAFLADHLAGAGMTPRHPVWRAHLVARAGAARARPSGEREPSAP